MMLTSVAHESLVHLFTPFDPLRKFFSHVLLNAFVTLNAFTTPRHVHVCVNGPGLSNLFSPSVIAVTIIIR